MKKSQLNIVVDAVSFLAFLFLLSTGFLLEYQLPVGSGGLQGYGAGHGASERPVHLLWGWTRHEWGQIHYWIALAMVTVLALHLLLHWKWIVCTIRGKPTTASGYRLTLGVVGLVFTVLLSAAPLISATSSMSRNELQELRAGSGSEPNAQANRSTIVDHDPSAESIRGSMTLRQIAESASISVVDLVRTLGLPEDADTGTNAGRLLRQHNLQMNDLRAAVARLQSGEQPRK